MEKEKATRRISINTIPPECVPFHMLTPRERETLQCMSDGMERSEIANRLGIVVKTVEAHISNMTGIGTPGRNRDHYERGKWIRLALVQDGINFGYLRHNVPADKPIRALSFRQNEVLELLLQGKSEKEIAEHLTISINTVEVHRYRISKKLHTKNIYHLAARTTYLKSRNMYRVYDGRGKNRKQLINSARAIGHQECP